MGYRRTLTFGWARRDTLAVVVIALTVSFLVGAAVLGVALGDQTTAIAAEYDTAYEIVDGQPTDGTDGGTVVPLTLAETAIDGRRTTVVGIPPTAPTLSVRGDNISFPSPEHGTLAVAEDGWNSTAATPDGETVPVASRSSHSLFPDSWFVTDSETAAAFDGSATVTIRSTEGRAATPLLSALEFFVRGSEELLRLLGLATLAAGVLVAVTAYSVVRITIRERRPDIAVLRSTGATPRQVLQLFVTRAVALTAIGAAVGYGFGLILVHLVVNVAVALGLPTSLNVQVTRAVAELFLPAFALFLLVGGISGFAAAYRSASRDPSRLGSPSGDGDGGRIRRVSRVLDTNLIGWEALVPTAATLTVFMCLLLLLTGVVGTAGPLSNAGERTITQPDAPHPIASSVPVVYADALRSQGVEASPEILLFEVYEGHPIVARGVNFSAYRDFSGIEVTRGEMPREEQEALIGADLARSTGLSTGDAIVVGGSTDASVMRLTITGTYAGTGIQDDQLLVSLPAGRQLGNVRADAAHLIRTRGIDEGDADASPIVVTDANLATREGQAGVAVAVTNLGLSEATREIEVALGERTRTTSVTLDSRRSARVFVPFPDASPGTKTLVVDDVRKTVAVGADADSNETGDLAVEAPETVPPDSAPEVRVTRDGEPAADATVRVGDRTVRTNADGVARVQFNSTGETTLIAETGERRATTSVTVSEDARRDPMLSVAVSPGAPSIFTRPEATATVRNPWERRIETTVAIAGPDTETRETLRLDPGETATAGARLPQRPAGSYTVTATAGETARATATYAVRGDERLGAALAQSGRYTGGGGITQAIQVVFGNVEVLVAAIAALLSVMTIGSTTAAFTRAVHTARREIGIRRATGASPRGVLWNAFVDALKIGTVAAVAALALAVGILEVLLSLGELRAFGLVLEPVLTPSVVGGALAGGLALAVVSATLATLAVVRAPPASLLVDRHISVPAGGEE